MAYQIVSDGACDLPVEFWEKHNLTVVPFYVSFDSINYEREIADVPIRDFYDRMVANEDVFPKSSMPSVQDYVDAFTPIVKEGNDIICICITTKFSGSMQSALNAKNMVLEEYPNAKITVIDSIINTVLQGIYVLEAIKLRDAGASYDEAIAELERIKSSGRIFFTVGSFDYLLHGGRIGKLSVLRQGVKALGIKPLITLREGEIHPSGITRGRNKSLDKVTDLLIEYLKENDNQINEFSLCIGFGYDIEEAKQFRSSTIERLAAVGITITEDDIPLYQIGATIAVHTGPYPLGYGIIKKQKFS